MASKTSAGLLMYRVKNGKIEFLLGHPGGPFFKNKNNGFWTIPKGEIKKDEAPLETAEREFEEETGLKPIKEFIPLGEIIQKNDKKVFAWAFESTDWQDDNTISIPQTNLVEIEWPPKSGKTIKFSEIDKLEFFDFENAKEKINQAQIPFLENLLKYIDKNL
ncbi:MAG: NUDIX domain-containing protein [Candidatus Pacebacteria bacterium]|nr:NUDIX domain-containing protein [Candidatus Paceibacterota bacterium]